MKKIFYLYFFIFLVLFSPIKTKAYLAGGNPLEGTFNIGDAYKVVLLKGDGIKTLQGWHEDKKVKI